MSVAALDRAVRRARLRRFAFALAVAAPPLAVAAVLAARGIDRGVAVAFASVLALAAVAIAVAHARAIDARALSRRYDDARPELEDSTALAQADDVALSPLQRLQRERVRERLARVAPPPPERLPWRALAASLAIAAIALAANWLDFTAATRPSSPAAAPRAAGTPPTRISHAELSIEPPAYTGLDRRTQAALAARVEAGSRLAWALALEPAPATLALEFHDGTTLALERGDDARWRGERVLAKSALYRIVPGGVAPLADDARHRLDVVADAPPSIRVIEPERTLVPLADGQRQWTLAFEASDDYGIARAVLTLTHARGTGENIEVTRREVVLAGEGDARARRYRHAVALAPYALSPGDDLIAKLAVSDNRAPAPQVSRSASYILRVPFEAAGEGSGVEGLVRDTLPAYFRSQRQIIIDTEALVTESPSLDADALTQRSDAIGVDQRILRLRYGQFLGEQTSVEGDHEEGAGHADEGGEGVSGGATSREVLEAFGHTHDDAEAATLLDPETQKLLRAALGEMWSAERHLRTGEPRAALPYEYRALDYIKQVQNATRIYLARVGLELPQVDEARRMTGEREGLRDRGAALAAAERGDAVPRAAWRALVRGDAIDAAALRAWLAANESSLDDAIGWYEAIDALARDARCAPCRERLAALVWRSIEREPPRAAIRPVPDAAGRAYLDSLGAPRE
jgi:hypothetical protein